MAGSGAFFCDRLNDRIVADIGISRFIFWGMAYLTLYPGAKKWAGGWRSAETVLNYAIIGFGFYILIAGTYVRFVFAIPTRCDLC